MTQTTNIGLKKIDGSENWRQIFDYYNDSMAKTDSAVAAVQDGLAIVANGNTHAAVAEGQFVYVRNHSTLAEGLYKASSAIGTNIALSTSNLTADGSGGLNDLQEQVTSLISKFTLIEQNITFTESTARADVAKVYKNGPVAMVSLNNVSFTKALSSGDVTLATLPYKPMNWVRFFGYTVNGTPIALGVNPSSGNLICSGGLTPVEATKLIYASCTYITND